MQVSYKKLPHFGVRIMTPRAESKSSELVSIFHEQSGWNLARVKLVDADRYTDVDLIELAEDQIQKMKSLQ